MRIYIVVDECDMVYAFRSMEEARQYVVDNFDEDELANVYIEEVSLR